MKALKYKAVVEDDRVRQEQEGLESTLGNGFN